MTMVINKNLVFQVNLQRPAVYLNEKHPFMYRLKSAFHEVGK